MTIPPNPHPEQVEAIADAITLDLLEGQRGNEDTYAWVRRIAILASLANRPADDLLTWLANHPRLSLEHYRPVRGDDDDDTTEWRVTKQGGSINDREWEVVGRGATPAEALTAARKHMEK